MTDSPRVARLHRVTGGESAMPLAALFILNAVDELDQVTYGVLAPDIRDTFALSEAATATIGALSAALAIMLAVPVGYMADRFNRTRMVAVAAVLWGSMMVLTGLSGFVGAVGLLVLARFGAGLGRVMNEPVHMSLLADYYAPANHGRVYSFHRSANAVGAMFVLACGALADLVGWRLGFVLLSIPTFLGLLLVSQLREPPRGASISVALASQATTADKVPFRQAWRELRAIPSLKRVWIGAVFLGGSAVPLLVFINFFFEHEYEVTSATARGAISMLFGAGALVGLGVGSTLATRAIQSAHLPRLAHLAGYTAAGVALGLLLLAQSPWMALSIACVFLVGLGASFQSYSLPLLASIAPAHLRAQALGYFVFFIGIGALTVTPIIATLGENHSYRLALSIVAILAIVAGLIYASASSYVDQDVKGALRSLDLRAAAQVDVESSPASASHAAGAPPSFGIPSSGSARELQKQESFRPEDDPNGASRENV